MTSRYFKLLIILIMLSIALTTSGCLSRIKTNPEAKVKKSEVKDDKSDSKNKNLFPDTANTSKEEAFDNFYKRKIAKYKAYPLGTIQKSETWQYQPSKINKTSTITNDLDVKHSPKKGNTYVLVYLKMTNISDMVQSPLISYDPEPVITANGKRHELEDGQIAHLPEKDQFIEGKDLNNSQSSSGWLIFEVPTGSNKLKFIIEDLIWNI